MKLKGLHQSYRKIQIFFPIPINYKLEKAIILKFNTLYYRFINNRGESYSRQFFQKHKLEDLYSSGKISFYDKNLTAIQNVFNNYYRLLPDAGNMVFEKTY